MQQMQIFLQQYVTKLCHCLQHFEQVHVGKIAANAITP
jgi:hypothetical protein